ncbi:HTH-type transcriptional repressor [Amycolatopsis sp. NBRC 101858]|uniref:TetR family transcriptional regulator n=1 Tax=Amycolatopsis sp. NBRC 101858 TaxID=3032200 RepID=UPI0024A08199|nr:TetR family transcriptional regulator [Amycolatopsis sp. NBRC 101858]GLY43293.1 HTH-type transcriptional repressor [Amycolatopsis sp. NBRC 101858]
MAPRDPEAKRRALLEAALAEFAEHGIAGARVDRLAGRAGCSAGLVYTYFGSKEELFDAVFDEVVVRTTEQAPITPHDLPEYAGALFDGQTAHPEVMRLATWHRLEQQGGRPAIEAVTRANQAKIDAIRQAQEEGRLSTRFTAPELLMLTINTASMWALQNQEISDLGPSDHAARRATVVEAVRRLVEP